MAFDSGVHLHLLRGGKEINPLPEPGLMAGPEHSILVRVLREGMGGADAAGGRCTHYWASAAIIRLADSMII
jgi:hypothetical protein